MPNFVARRVSAAHLTLVLALMLVAAGTLAQDDPLADVLDKDSPWLLTPTVSSDP
jgi:hypothetical protein